MAQSKMAKRPFVHPAKTVKKAYIKSHPRRVKRW